MAHCAGRISRVNSGVMSTPQDSPRRRKQKARRTKQLAEWRAKKAAGSSGAGDKAAKAEPKKKAAKKSK